MTFVTVKDTVGKTWILNVNHIVAVVPTFGDENWVNGTQIHLTAAHVAGAFVNIANEEAEKLLAFLKTRS